MLPSLESGVLKTAKRTSSWAVTPSSAARSDPGWKINVFISIMWIGSGGDPVFWNQIQVLLK